MEKPKGDLKKRHKKVTPIIIYNYLAKEALAKVSNGHPPQPLPSREGLIYQPSHLVAYGSEPTAQRGEGKGEGVMDFCKSLKGYFLKILIGGRGNSLEKRGVRRHRNQAELRLSLRKYDLYCCLHSLLSLLGLLCYKTQ